MSNLEFNLRGRLSFQLSSSAILPHKKEKGITRAIWNLIFGADLPQRKSNSQLIYLQKDDMEEPQSTANSCANCGETEARLARCSRCRSVWYCSRECQSSHWRASHKRECLTYTEDHNESMDENNEKNTNDHNDDDDMGEKDATAATVTLFQRPLTQRHTNQRATADNTEEETDHYLVDSLAEISSRMKRAVDQGAKLVFYDHMEGHWLGVPTEATMTYREHVKYLKWLVGDGHVEIQAWDGVSAEGVTLYPMVIKFPNPCPDPTWWLLARRGSPEDSDWTPYLFVNPEARRKVMEIIMTHDIAVPPPSRMRLFL